MKSTWREHVTIVVAVLLMGAGIWANVGGSCSPMRGAWVSQVMR